LVEPFFEFGSAYRSLSDFISISHSAIPRLVGEPRVVETGAELDRQLGREVVDYEAKLERAKREAALAQHEVENDFPLLHSQALVALWGQLEHMVRSFVVRWLEHLPSPFSSDPVAQVRVRIGEYDGLETEERLWYVVGLMERELGSALKQGVNRFESLLSGFSSMDLFRNTPPRSCLRRSRSVMSLCTVPRLQTGAFALRALG
jgi:hypothetical protein